MPQMPQMPRGFSAGGGVNQQATFNGEPNDAFAQALRAIAQSGGEVTWQQVPSAAKFLIGKKDFWTTGGFTMKYDGDVQVARSGPGQTTARFSLKLNWGSYVPLGATTIVAVLVLSMTNYYFAAMGFLFMIAILVYSAWAVSSQLPDKMLKDIIRNLQGGGASVPTQSRPQPAPSYAPTPPPQPAPQPQPTAAPAGDATASIVEQIKQLAGLRDAGAITADEFEAKKSELLKRI